MSTGFRITTEGTSVLQSAGGATLQSLTINTVGSGATITLYDSPTASGKEIAVITPGSPASLFYGIELINGLTVVVANAACDITVTIGSGSSSGGGVDSGGVESVQAGSGVEVDSDDPRNPIVSITGATTPRSSHDLLGELDTPQVAINTPWQNTLDVDLFVTVVIPVTSSAGGQFFAGVSPATVPTVDAASDMITTASLLYVTLCYKVASQYWLRITDTGTISLGTPTTSLSE